MRFADRIVSAALAAGTFVAMLASGNSGTDTLGFKNTLGFGWEKSSLEIKSGGVRANSSRRSAVGTPADFRLGGEEVRGADPQLRAVHQHHHRFRDHRVLRLHDH
jgi:hypothetical protein